MKDKYRVVAVGEETDFIVVYDLSLLPEGTACQRSRFFREFVVLRHNSLSTSINDGHFIPGNIPNSLIQYSKNSRALVEKQWEEETPEFIIFIYECLTSRYTMEDAFVGKCLNHQNLHLLQPFEMKCASFNLFSFSM